MRQTSNLILALSLLSLLFSACNWGTLVKAPQNKQTYSVPIRQAFALAIDKAAIAKNVWPNTLTPTNHIVPEGMTAYNPNLKGPGGTQSVTGNAKRAQQLLQQGLREEGWSSVPAMPPITLSYVTNTANFDQEVSALIQQWQKVLEVTASTDPEDGGSLLDKVTNATNNPQGIQIWGLAWVGEYPDPQESKRVRSA